MKLESRKTRSLREAVEAKLRASEKRIADISSLTPTGALDALDSSRAGLSEFIVNASREYYGDNILQTGEEQSFLAKLYDAFINPFSIILIGLATVSLFTDVILTDDKTPWTVVIILTIVLFSGLLRFTQETRSGNAAKRLAELVKTTTAVTRKGVGRQEIALEDVVVGDIVHLAAGDMVPADARVLEAKDLFLNESALTGESEPAEKTAAALPADGQAGGIAQNIAYMGSTVISGSATCLVVAVGNGTMIGSIARRLGAAPEEPTSFERGVNDVSLLLLRFMLVMVPLVFVINGAAHHDWFSAFLFAISIAVGLTPEMLPMLVSTCLSKGAVAMADRKTVVKNLNAIQNLGSIDVLCTDKTGTLTQNRVVLEYNLDVNGEDDLRVLRHAFLNSFYQTGLRNLMDQAIIEYADDIADENPELRDLRRRYAKVDEIPFDFERRRLSVVVEDAAGKRQMVTKGAVEEMLSISAYAEIGGVPVPLTDEVRAKVLATVHDLNDDGMRVIAVAQKTNPSPAGAFSVADEHDMVLLGYLAFLDPPKESAAEALKALAKYGVTTKILTGDNDLVTQSVCWQVDIDADRILLGPDIDAMSDEALAKAVEEVNVFAKVTPSGKERIVRQLRANGHAVGFLGDGINDAPAMKAADIGISVENAVDIAKETADVILLEKNLAVLEDGIIEGRKVYANMLKYIKLTASSNFGNMFSVLAASVFLPFLPMASVQLLLLNLIYDISCTSIPWDNVDSEFLLRPKEWSAKGVSRFMLWFGPISSLCDILTYLALYFVVCPLVSGGLTFHQITDPAVQALYIAVFQSGWFVESMWTQSTVIHFIRTKKLPFVESRASLMVSVLTALAICIATAVPFLPVVSGALGFAALPGVYFAFLAGIVVLYAVLVSIVKKIYVGRHGELL